MAMSSHVCLAVERYVQARVVQMRVLPNQYETYEFQFHDGRLAVFGRDYLEHMMRYVGGPYRGGGGAGGGSWPGYSPQELQVDHHAVDSARYAMQSMREYGYGMKVMSDPRQAYVRGVDLAVNDPCRSCKKDHGPQKLDHHGFCKSKQEEFWAKVRRLYWHRHLTTKKP